MLFASTVNGFDVVADRCNSAYSTMYLQEHAVHSLNISFHSILSGMVLFIATLAHLAVTTCMYLNVSPEVPTLWSPVVTPHLKLSYYTMN